MELSADGQAVTLRHPSAEKTSRVEDGFGMLKARRHVRIDEMDGARILARIQREVRPVIAVDTNILARFYIEDEADAESKRQRALARSVLGSDRRFFVPLSVVQELEWVMRGAYGFARNETADVLDHLLGSPQRRRRRGRRGAHSRPAGIGAEWTSPTPCTWRFPLRARNWRPSTGT